MGHIAAHLGTSPDRDVRQSYGSARGMHERHYELRRALVRRFAGNESTCLDWRQQRHSGDNTIENPLEVGRALASLPNADIPC